MEISTRPWLYALSQKYNKPISRIMDIPVAEFEYYQSHGIKIIYMMGVWHLGPYGLHHDQTDPNLLQSYAQVLPGYTMADIIGSPFAITNYTVNPEVGTVEDLKWLRSLLHKLGMALFLDFVPNHTAVDCDWTTDNMDYYVRAPKGTQPPYDPSVYLPSGIAYGSDPYSGAWTDTAQLNYWNPDTRKARILEILTVLSVSDGIRIDMSMLLLNDVIEKTWGPQLASWGWQRPSTEFWAEASAAVRQQYPNAVMMGEAYWGTQSQLISLGLDFCYEKQLYDQLASGNDPSIESWIKAQPLTTLAHDTFFAENHDQPRAANYFGSWQRGFAASAVSFTLPAMSFSYFGQWSGFKNTLAVQLRRAAPEEVVSQCEEAYHALFDRVLAHPLLQGNFSSFSQPSVVGSGQAGNFITSHYQSTSTSDSLLVVVNYSGDTSFGRVVLDDAISPSNNGTVTLHELYSNTYYERQLTEVKGEGLGFVVAAWGIQAFTYASQT
jgi:hypothetical protein